MYLYMVSGSSHTKIHAGDYGRKESPANFEFFCWFTLLLLAMDFGIMLHVLEVVFNPMIRILIFSTFPLNLLRSTIMNKSTLGRLNGFSFQELSADFRLEQSFRCVTCEFLINLHTADCRPNVFMDHRAWLGI